MWVGRGGKSNENGASRRSEVALALVEVVALEDDVHVVAGAGEGDAVAEIAGGDGGALVGVADPFVHAALAGVVFGEGEGDGVVLGGVALEGFLEVPCAGLDVDLGGEEVGGDEGGAFVLAGPVSGGGLHDLHEAAFAVLADFIGAEAALAPDDGFDEHGIDVVFLADVEDEGVVTVITGEVKDFLKELKIMAYVGQHPNIASLIGGYTEKLFKCAFKKTFL